MSEVSEVQDTVSFLEDARLVYPNVTHLLNKLQLLALDMDPRQPFSRGRENEDYLKLVEAYFAVKFNNDTAKSELRNALIEPRNKGKAVDVEGEEAVIKCLEMVNAGCCDLGKGWRRKGRDSVLCILPLWINNRCRNGSRLSGTTNCR